MKSNRQLLPIICSLAFVPLQGIAAKPSDSNRTPGQDSDYAAGELHDAWMEGKLETAFLLNRHLNNFTIDVEVDDQTALLEGTVPSAIDRDLAEQISMDTDGINTVRNHLQIDREMDGNGMETERSFGDRVSDATLTAEVKLKLLANSDTEGLSINVETVDDVVTLEGDVSSNAQKRLSGQIANEVEGVTSVNNRLIVRN